MIIIAKKRKKRTFEMKPMGLKRLFGKKDREYLLLKLADTKRDALAMKKRVIKDYYARIQPSPKKYKGKYMVWRSIDRKLSDAEYRVLRKLGFGMGVQMTNSSIAKDLNLKIATATKGTKNLYEKGLLKRYKDGRRYYYSVNKKGFDYLKERHPSLLKRTLMRFT